MKLHIILVSAILVTSCAKDSKNETYPSKPTLVSQGNKDSGNAALSPLSIDQISAGDEHVCALSNKKVTCWGDNRMGQLDIPVLKNPRQISSGSHHSCALTEDGVICWGGAWKYPNSIPAPVVKVPTELKNPRTISSGYNFSCALTDDGVVCWGENLNGETNVPALKNPNQISSGGDFSCAATDKGIECWGSNREGQLNAPYVDPSELMKISVGHHVACVTSSHVTKLRCWGRASHWDIPNDMTVQTQDVSVGGLVCGIMPSPNRVVCFSVWAVEHNETTVPVLNNPTSVSSGSNFACALTDDGVKCWGSNEFGQTKVPTDLTR